MLNDFYPTFEVIKSLLATDGSQLFERDYILKDELQAAKKPLFLLSAGPSERHTLQWEVTDELIATKGTIGQY